MSQGNSMYIISGPEPIDELQGEMLEADFSANTITFTMHGEYYAKAGTYIILPMEKYRTLKAAADEPRHFTGAPCADCKDSVRCDVDKVCAYAPR